jgi:hypothetical protein
MEPASELSLDRADIAPAQPANGRDKRKRHVATKAQLLTRDTLDGRTNAAKLFDRLIADIESDLGGRDQLSTIEQQLVVAFAGACVTLEHLNCQLALGQKIDLTQHSSAVGAMVRVASRLGLQRRARDVGPSLGEVLRADWERKRLEQQPT